MLLNDDELPVIAAVLKYLYIGDYNGTDDSHGLLNRGSPVKEDESQEEKGDS